MARSYHVPRYEIFHAAVRVRTVPPMLTAVERDRLVRRAKLLAWGGIAWHAVEALIAIRAGLAAASIALVGFGFDSLIESLAGFVVVWRFAALLAGLGANALLGWWWADPAAALVIAAVAVREGVESWRGERCCDSC